MVAEEVTSDRLWRSSHHRAGSDVSGCVAAAPRIMPSWGDGARVLLVSHHEDHDLRALVRAWIARRRVHDPRRLVEHLAGLQGARRCAIDGELVGALDHIAERVMTRMAVRRAAR